MTTKMTTNKRNPFSRLLLPLGALTLALGLSTSAQADPPKGKRGAKLQRMCAEIKCSDGQEKQLRAMHKEMRTDAKGDRTAISEARGQMASEWAKASPSEASLERLQKKISVHEANLADRRLDMMLEIHAVLSPEQRKSFGKLLAKRKGGKKGKEGKKGKKGKEGKKGKTSAKKASARAN